MPDPDITRRTFRLELQRAVPVGILETVGATFAVLIAVKCFDASASAKSWLIAAPRGGLIASFAIVPLLYYFRRPLNHLAGWIHLLAAAAFAFAAAFPESLSAFVGGVVVGLFCYGLQVPLMTKLYRTNYPDDRRGKLFSITGIARSAAAIGFSKLGGYLLGVDLMWFQWLLVGFAVCSAWSGLLIFLVPYESKGDLTKRPSLFRAFRWLKTDRMFSTLLAAWMVMGIGNLIMFSLTVEYIANPIHGIAYSEVQVALLTGVVPGVVKLATTFSWGILFDRINFFVLRIILNGVFAAFMLFYFSGREMWMFMTGAALLGLALGGGNIAWSLWVTKIAPEDRVTEYMSMHTFFTGLRGVTTPFIAFWCVGRFPIQHIAWTCAALVIGSSFLILPYVKQGRAGNSETLRTRNVD